jgi:hypothetical protein
MASVTRQIAVSRDSLAVQAFSWALLKRQTDRQTDTMRSREREGKLRDK